MEQQMANKDRMSDVGFRMDHKALLADLLETTKNIKEAVMSEETADLDSMMMKRRLLIQQIEGNHLQYLDDETNQLEPLVKQIISADAECVSLAHEKVDHLREELRELNQMKKLQQGYTQKKPKPNGAFIDTKK
jgi:L-lysine 2,3-aminomutase